MSIKWPEVCVGDFLKPHNETTRILPQDTYAEVTVRLWGKGIKLRRLVGGDMISAETRKVVRAGQFIISRIDARHGACGIIPDELDGAIVSNDFPVYDIDTNVVLPDFLDWICKTSSFIILCEKMSEGTTNRVRLKEDRFLSERLPVPSVKKQQMIADKINYISQKMNEAQTIKSDSQQTIGALLCSSFSRLISGVQYLPMEEVCPLVRRPVSIEMGEEYPELGVRCFGKGTFHKPALDFLSVGTKKLYHIHPGDLVFSNVFAWEGAIAVSQSKDEGRVGSHRFITCLPKEGVVTAEFLNFYFQTPEGLEKIGKASPGGAGRNRTLGLKKLAKIHVPVPAYGKQMWFNNLQNKVQYFTELNKEIQIELDALLPSVLDKAFKGELV